MIENPKYDTGKTRTHDLPWTTFPSVFFLNQIICFWFLCFYVVQSCLFDFYFCLQRLSIIVRLKVSCSVRVWHSFCYTPWPVCCCLRGSQWCFGVGATFRRSRLDPIPSRSLPTSLLLFPSFPGRESLFGHLASEEFYSFCDTPLVSRN